MDDEYIHPTSTLQQTPLLTTFQPVAPASVTVSQITPSNYLTSSLASNTGKLLNNIYYVKACLF